MLAWACQELWWVGLVQPKTVGIGRPCSQQWFGPPTRPWFCWEVGICSMVWLICWESFLLDWFVVAGFDTKLRLAFTFTLDVIVGLLKMMKMMLCKTAGCWSLPGLSTIQAADGRITEAFKVPVFSHSRDFSLNASGRCTDAAELLFLTLV